MGVRLWLRPQRLRRKVPSGPRAFGSVPLPGRGDACVRPYGSREPHGPASVGHHRIDAQPRGRDDRPVRRDPGTQRLFGGNSVHQLYRAHPAAAFGAADAPDGAGTGHLLAKRDYHRAGRIYKGSGVDAPALPCRAEALEIGCSCLSEFAGQPEDRFGTPAVLQAVS